MGPLELFLFAQSLDLVLLEQFLKDHAMQIVEFGPRNLALAYLVHRRPVCETPAVDEPRPVNIQALDLAPASGLGNHRTAPVHNGTEYIEDACLHVGKFGVHARAFKPETSSGICPATQRQVSDAPLSY